MTRQETMWAAFKTGDRLMRWTVRDTRAECIHEAVQGCMGVDDYNRLLTDSDRWNFAYRRGCRVRKVVVTVKEPK